MLARLHKSFKIVKKNTHDAMEETTVQYKKWTDKCEFTIEDIVFSLDKASKSESCPKLTNCSWSKPYRRRPHTTDSVGRPQRVYPGVCYTDTEGLVIQQFLKGFRSMELASINNLKIHANKHDYPDFKQGDICQNTSWAENLKKAHEIMKVHLVDQQMQSPRMLEMTIQSTAQCK